MQAAAQQGLGLVAAAGGQDFHLYAEPLAQLLDGQSSRKVSFSSRSITAGTPRVPLDSRPSH